MSIPDWPNLVTMFYDQAQRHGERPFLWRKRSGAYRPVTWREVAARVTSFARGLIQLGIEPGDRVALVCENRPAWLISDLGIMAAGAITVPAYTTNTTADHLHILENSGAKAAIVSTRKLLDPLLTAAAQSTNTRHIIAIDPIPEERVGEVDIVPWRELIQRGDRDHTNMIMRAASIDRETVACLIYTSGTGGAPKGVMLPHRSILHNCFGALDVLETVGLKDDAFLSFLPLSHAYEHTVGQFLPTAMGAEIYYGEGADKIAQNLIETHPTIFSTVPRLLEVIRERVLFGIRKTGGSSEQMFLRTLQLGRKRLEQPNDLSLWERVMDFALDKTVRRKISERFGGRLKALVSGGAPLNPEIGLFFSALGLPVIQGYGQTEAGPLISVNRPGSIKLHTVGQPIKDTEVRIADDGEILVRGPLVMHGYWKNEEATQSVLRDGWLHTGDIGDFDADGHLHITDRKKDLIVNSGGDNISPSRVEGLLTTRPEIANAMVYGDRRPHLVALIVPDDTWLSAWCKQHGKSLDLHQLSSDRDLHKNLAAVIDEVNKSLSVTERVRRFAIAPHPFTIENGQLTPTQKLRRHVLRETYGATLESLYD